MKQIKFLAFAAAVIFALASCDKTPIENGENNLQDENHQNDSTEVVVSTDNLYQFKVLDGAGDSVSLADYKDKVVLIINTATECGYTPQYSELQRMYDEYSEQGFIILDFPCNQFAGQAPGSYEEIHDFVTENYKITFPQFDKILVNGNNASPLYVWLKSKKPGDIKWNFTKFLINRNGEVVERFEPAYSLSKVEESIVEQL